WIDQSARSTTTSRPSCGSARGSKRSLRAREPVGLHAPEVPVPIQASQIERASVKLCLIGRGRTVMRAQGSGFRNDDDDRGPGVTIEFELSRTHLPIASVYRHARELPEATAMVDASTRITYREFLHRIRSAAARLAAAGVERGDRVALVAGNCAEFPVAVYATNYLGAIIVPVNFRLAAGEVAYILGDSAPSVVVTDEDRAPIVRAAVAEAGATVQVLDLVSLADPAEIGRAHV